MRPYVSFVAVSRNDDHGGDLNARMQVFVTTLLEQAGRHRVPIELIIVEWNPPPERRRIAEEFDWSAINDYCRVRIITVPQEIHASYLHAKGLPLYQMIGKNVGIRRAEGEFVAATNIDIIFDDDFFTRIAGCDLQKAICYVANRLDVAQPFPYDAALEEKLEYCRNHVIRINTRWGSENTITGDFAKIYSRYPPFVEIAGAWINAIIGFPILGIRVCGSYAKAVARAVFELGYSILPLIKMVFACPRESISGSQLRADYEQFVELRRNHAANLTDRMRRIPGYFVSQGAHHAEHFARIRSRRNFERLQTNACGDLTIMDRPSWNRIHGYAEYDMFPMHIDGLACWAAHAAGIRQLVLDDVHIYHIEHAPGSGFTPEHQHQLWQRLTDAGVPYIDWRLLDELIAKLLEGSIDYRLSSARWGLEGAQMDEKIFGKW
jgi:hypothetical protein